MDRSSTDLSSKCANFRSIIGVWVDLQPTLAVNVQKNRSIKGVWIDLQLTSQVFSGDDKLENDNHVKMRKPSPLTTFPFDLIEITVQLGGMGVLAVDPR